MSTPQAFPTLERGAGGLQGAAAGEGTQRDIIKRCMQGRGYSVLN